MRKAVSIFLVFQIIFTSMGWASNAHLCGGKVVETSLTLGLQNEGFGMEANSKTCPSKSEKTNSSLQKNCCENSHLSLKNESPTQLEFNKITIEKPLLLFAMVWVVKMSNASLAFDRKIDSDFPPPLIIRLLNLGKLFQVFLL